MMSSLVGYGWQPDLPDPRDYFASRADVQELLALAPPGEQRPEDVDLREFFPDIHHQQTLNASPVYACADLYEYFERRAYGRLRSLSRRFLFKNSRALQRVCGNAPVGLRTTLKALVTFGSPPVQLWPEDIADFDRDPPPLSYSFAPDFRSVRYVRLDQRNETGEQTLHRVQEFLAAGYPVAFGFSVPDSVTADGEILFRPTFDAVLGGQAMIAVGYSDHRLSSTRGALLIRNSWGASWGDQGHAWLPYAFVEHQLAGAFWTLVQADWIGTGEFFRPRVEAQGLL